MHMHVCACEQVSFAIFTNTFVAKIFETFIAGISIALHIGNLQALCVQGRINAEWEFWALVAAAKAKK